MCSSKNSFFFPKSRERLILSRKRLEVKNKLDPKAIQRTLVYRNWIIRSREILKSIPNYFNRAYTKTVFRFTRKRLKMKKSCERQNESYAKGLSFKLKFVQIGQAVLEMRLMRSRKLEIYEIELHLY